MSSSSSSPSSASTSLLLNLQGMCSLWDVSPRTSLFSRIRLPASVRDVHTCQLRVFQEPPGGRAALLSIAHFNIRRCRCHQRRPPRRPRAAPTPITFSIHPSRPPPPIPPSSPSSPSCSSTATWFPRAPGSEAPVSRGVQPPILVCFPPPGHPGQCSGQRSGQCSGQCSGQICSGCGTVLTQGACCLGAVLALGARCERRSGTRECQAGFAWHSGVSCGVRLALVFASSLRQNTSGVPGGPRCNFPPSFFLILM